MSEQAALVRESPRAGSQRVKGVSVIMSGHLVNQGLWRLAQEHRPPSRRGVPIEGAVGDSQAVGVDGANGTAAPAYLTLIENGVVVEVTPVDDGPAVSNIGSSIRGQLRLFRPRPPRRPHYQ